MLRVESTGKNIEEAILSGLAELKVSREDVDIKIIEKGGLFKKAKVVLTVDEDVEEKLKQRQEKLDLAEENQEKEITVEQEELVNEQPNVELEQTKDEPKKQEQELYGEVSNVASGVIDFLKKYCDLQQITFNYLIQETEDDINIQIQGEGTDKLIGYRGEGINSLQYICNIVAGKINKNCPRVYINVGNFKQEREQSLIKLARRLATKVAKTKQSMKLEPMTAYERKIIHNALKNDSFVKTHSVGEEPKRCLVIELK